MYGWTVSQTVCGTVCLSEQSVLTVERLRTRSAAMNVVRIVGRKYEPLQLFRLYSGRV